MSANDPIELAILAGAAAALLRRAQRQERIARDRTSVGDRGAVIRDGEATVAQRLAEAFSELAAELDVEAHR
jgi:hypothetical protein